MARGHYNYSPHMKTGSRSHLIYVCLILLGTLFAAAPRIVVAKRVALVVGIANYMYSPRLDNPNRDAQRIAASLQGLGFEVVTALDSDLQQLETSLDTFYARAEGADAALFYYAGHGFQLDGVNYLVPRNAQLRSEARVRQETIALQDVISSIERRSHVTLVFLDACRDNPISDDLQRSVKGVSRSAAVARGLAPMTIRNPDTLLVFAAAPGRTASDGEGENSPFAKALLGNIIEPGVDIELVMKHVTRDVSNATHGEQIPERLSRLTSDFMFNERRSAPAAGGGKEISGAGRVGAKAGSAGEKEGRNSGTVANSGASNSGAEARPLGCIRVGGTNRKSLQVQTGSILCSESGADRAIITRLVPQAVVYSVNGVETACKPNDLCQFNWEGGPFFRVLVNDGTTEGEPIAATLVFGR